MNVATMLKFAALVAAGLSLASCATLSREECVAGNWDKHGYDDGAAGFPASRINEHQEACAEHKVAPDVNLYNLGRTRGLAVYCTPQGGWRTGIRRDDYRNVCSGPAEQSFLNAYRLSLEIGRARSDAESARIQADLARSNLRSKGDKATSDDRSRVWSAENKERDMRRRADDIAGRNKQSYIQLFGAVPE